ncbi:MAG TPA: hypothetical protein VKM54_11575 [Myxococcota bacterium]|nr:hypothetical protein [Myxococcota bacterium]
MAKGKDLGVNRGSPPNERSKCSDQGGEGRRHRRSLIEPGENFNIFNVDRVLGSHDD